MTEPLVVWVHQSHDRDDYEVSLFATEALAQAECERLRAAEQFPSSAAGDYRCIARQDVAQEEMADAAT